MAGKNGVGRDLLVVGIGGSPREGSTTDGALAMALAAAARAGARTLRFDGPFIARLPMFVPGRVEQAPEVAELVEAVRQADGVILASPSYHGGVAGSVKNAIDHLEALRHDRRPYLGGRAVGCLTTAGGEQGAAATLAALRAAAHALRGWPTPLGVAITSGGLLDAAPNLDLLGRQVHWFARACVGVNVGVASV
ncbi:MAG TPA: NADPH-dependent FMN reductase [Micromonosporaceae bacterium]|nr:NADPH-dependent FMN reductase [Micromonosporaceae bacterium]